MSSDGRALHFDDPPLVEAALALEFAPIKGWGAQYYGLFWQAFRDNFPRFQTQAPLLNVGAVPPQFGNPFGEFIRCWLTDESGNRLIQLQYDRIIYNWRRISGAEEYPHYDSVRDEFSHIWDRFTHFLHSEQLDYPVVHRCEVTYVNNLPSEKWQDLIRLEPLAHLLEDARAQQISVTYALPGAPESFGISLQPVIRMSDAVQLQQFQLTCSTKPESSNKDLVFAALDRGHERIIRVFTNLITEEARTQWSLKRA